MPIQRWAVVQIKDLVGVGDVTVTVRKLWEVMMVAHMVIHGAGDRDALALST